MSSVPSTPLHWQEQDLNSFQGSSFQNKYKVLLIDDCPTNLKLLSELLSRKGFKTRCVSDGALAIAAARIFHPDLILLDIMMPEMDGFEVCQCLKDRAETRSIPIIFLSALNDELNKVRGFKLGAVDYITKPFRQSEVFARIEHHLQVQALQRQLKQAELKYRSIFENALEGLFQLSPYGQYRNANPALADILGYESPEDLIRNVSDIGTQIYVESNRWNRLKQTIDIDGQVSHVESQVWRKDGRAIWVSECLRVVKDSSGGILRYEGNTQDISDRKQMEQSLFREKELAQVTLQSIGDAVLTTDARGRVTSFNPIAAKLAGWWLRDKAIGKPLRDIFKLVHGETRRLIPNPVEQALRENRIVELTDCTILVAEDGTERYIEDSAAPIRDRAGQVLGAVMVFRDVTAERQLTQKLSWQAEHDNLTGLNNRLAFEQQLAAVLDDTDRDNTLHVLCYLDLDQFKIVNDTAGHAAGDELLRQVAKLLRQHTRASDSLARLGGDEFSLLLYNCTLARAQHIAEDIRASIQHLSFVWDEKLFKIGVSIGLVSISATSGNIKEVLSAADAACYAAKDRGRNCVHTYQPNDRDLARQRGERQWIVRINRALQDEVEHFCLYRQKIVPVRQGQERTHYEILLRLVDREGHLISPMSFIPAAERYGLMPAIDRWVIRTFLNYYHHQQQYKEADEGLYAINLSGTSLNDNEFYSFLKDELSKYPDVCEMLCFEITETAAISSLSQTARAIHELKSLGCYFALDDFGSGMSSFAYLKELPVDFLKIDGHFVKDIARDGIDFAMVECINRMGHVNGTKTIAEFVENEQVLEKLRDIEVDYAQGYAIGKPQPLVC